MRSSKVMSFLFFFLLLLLSSSFSDID
jgi:hypothetical protein